MVTPRHQQTPKKHIGLVKSATLPLQVLDSWGQGRVVLLGLVHLPWVDMAHVQECCRVA